MQSINTMTQGEMLITLYDEPVSYTHLDVYKRQDIEMPEMDGHRLTKLVKEDSVPVSYTHLSWYCR